MKKRVIASLGGSVGLRTQNAMEYVQAEAPSQASNTRLTNVVSRRTLSEIKLKRTDTTLDLSQKAKRAGEEKKKKDRNDVFVSFGGVARATLER